MIIPQAVPWYLVPLAIIAQPLIWGALKKIAVKVPDLVLGRLRSQWAEVIASGRIDAPTQRLVTRWAHAGFDWAESEWPNVPGPEKMDVLIANISRMPYIGWLIQGNEANIKDLLQLEFITWKQKLDEEMKEGA